MKCRQLQVRIEAVSEDLLLSCGILSMSLLLSSNHASLIKVKIVLIKAIFSASKPKELKAQHSGSKKGGGRRRRGRR